MAQDNRSDLARLDRMERRLQALEDAEAIRNLKSRYAALCDKQYDADAIAMLFTEDALWESPGLGRFEGREAIRNFFRGASEIFSFAIHYSLNGHIEVEGDTARARWYLFMPCTVAAGNRAMWRASIDHETYVRVDGVWMFRHKRSEPLMNVPFESGWAQARFAQMSDGSSVLATGQESSPDREVALCLAELLDRLGIETAHFAGRGTGDLRGLLSQHPARVASLTVLCPAVLDTRSLAPLGERLLVVTGDRGPGARRVQAGLPDLLRASTVVLEDYAGLTWSDIAAERGDRIVAGMQEFLSRHRTLPSVRLSEQEGNIAGISYRVRGAGAPLMLLPLDLSPGQWAPLIPTLAAHYCTITLGGALLGSVASLEERGRSGYMAVVRGLLDALVIVPGESVLEIGCGSGVIMRELARRTAGANRLLGRDINPYLLREARALARRDGLLDRLDFGEGHAEALPLPDGAVDVALSSTVFEEGNADLMLSEIVRVTRPGGRVGIAVRAIDMPFWVNLPLNPALKAKVDAPGIIGGGAAPNGVADMSLYRRLAALGLTGLKCFPQLVSVVPGSERIERYQQQILAALTPAEAETWHRAVAAAEADGTFFIAQAYHCAVGTTPAE